MRKVLRHGSLSIFHLIQRSLKGDIVTDALMRMGIQPQDRDVGDGVYSNEIITQYA
jgi:hypothetical protein